MKYDELRALRDAAPEDAEIEVFYPGDRDSWAQTASGVSAFYTAAYTAIPALLDEVARIAELEAALSKLHSATLQMAVRLGDAGLYGTPDDLPGGKNQIALETARALMEDRR